jgi:hypothetical protein
MLDSIVQQFLGGGAESMSGPQLHQHVKHMAGNAPAPSLVNAVAGALGQMGPQGFGQSVQQASEGASQGQRNELGSVLLHAIEQGGGSPQQALARHNADPNNMQPSSLAGMAMQVAEQHPDVLASLLGTHISQNASSGSSGSGGGLMEVLGNPMVRQIGMHLAQNAFR